jgi:pimeloyl-ACP methyl ester carboxylesterase
MVLAAEHHEDLKGLVLVDIAPFEMTGRPSRPPPPDYFADDKDARRYFKERYPGFTQEAIENRMRHALTKDEEGKLKLKSTGDAIRPGLATDLWPYVEQIGTPTLMILGSESTLVTQETIKRMKSVMPDLRVVTVQGATHMVPQDKPKEFEGHLRTFLEGISPV